MSTPALDRGRVADLADNAMALSRISKLSYKQRHERASFVEYLKHHILLRIAEGVSYDCDEYRQLWKMAREER